MLYFVLQVTPSLHTLNVPSLLLVPVCVLFKLYLLFIICMTSLEFQPHKGSNLCFVHGYILRSEGSP